MGTFCGLPAEGPRIIPQHLRLKVLRSTVVQTDPDLTRLAYLRRHEGLIQEDRQLPVQQERVCGTEAWLKGFTVLTVNSTTVTWFGALYAALSHSTENWRQ